MQTVCCDAVSYDYQPQYNISFNIMMVKFMLNTHSPNAHFSAHTIFCVMNEACNMSLFV